MMARKHTSRARIVTKFVRIPEELEPGKVRCAACSRVVALTPNGHLRGHRTPAGEPCAHRATYLARPVIEELPEVLYRGETPRLKSAPERPGREEGGINHESRLEAGSQCEDCGRWLPGERHVCGKCSNARAANRRKNRSA